CSFFLTSPARAAVRGPPPPPAPPPPPPLPPVAPLMDAERSALLAALEQHRWHMTHVAAQLGVSRNTLYRKLRKHGIARSL
ncbi:helix-turn-helix domain-containing protein, partial [Pseudomonas caricapapayae]